MTLLSAVRRACALASITAPPSVIGASGGVGATMREIAQIELEELSARHDWRQIRAAVEFQSAGGVVQYGRLPDDFERMVAGTFWNRSTNTQLAGPADARTWAQASTDLGSPICYPMYRLMGDDIHILPAPTGGEKLAFEYISKELIKHADGSTGTEWTADDDVSRLPERLLVLGLVWRWKHARGLDYAEDMSTYERAIEQMSGEDAHEISTASALDDWVPPLPSVIVAPNG